VVASDRPARGPALLVLGAGAGQLGLLAAARARGLYVIAADRDPGAPGFGFADRRAVVSVEDERALERLADAERVDGIVAPGIDWPVVIAARIAARHALPHPLSPETAALATSKLRQRERFRAAGVPQPAAEVARTPGEALEAAARIGFPCAVKAPDRQGQRGLGVATEPGEVEAAAERAIAASRGGVCLVEELVPGPEITVNAFSLGGRLYPLTVTDRVVAEPPAFGVALAHVWPSELPPEDVGAAVAAATAAAAALGIEEGPTYTQLRVGPDGPRVIELAARLGGGHDAELCAAALGVDLNGLALAAALGEPVEEAALVPAVPPPAGGACVKFLVAPPGPLGGVTGVEDARAVPGVAAVHVYRRPGHVFTPLRRGSDRAGAVLAAGATRAEALARAGRAAELVRFRMADAEALV
jgi:biotin carboxylase